MWLILTPSLIWINVFSSCQDFRSKKFLASNTGLVWHTSLTNVSNYTWQKCLATCAKDLFIHMQVVTVLFIFLYLLSLFMVHIETVYIHHVVKPSLMFPTGNAS